MNRHFEGLMETMKKFKAGLRGDPKQGPQEYEGLLSTRSQSSMEDLTLLKVTKQRVQGFVFALGP
jgi:hypothetical protein